MSGHLADAESVEVAVKELSNEEESFLIKADAELTSLQSEYRRLHTDGPLQIASSIPSDGYSGSPAGSSGITA